VSRLTRRSARIRHGNHSCKCRHSHNNRNHDVDAKDYPHQSVERYVETQPDKMLQFFLERPQVLADSILDYVKYGSELQLTETCLLRYAQQEVDRRARGVNIRRMKSPYLNWRETKLEKEAARATFKLKSKNSVSARKMEARDVGALIQVDET
jgi:hypothetical protein